MANTPNVQEELKDFEEKVYANIVEDLNGKVTFKLNKELITSPHLREVLAGDEFTNWMSLVLDGKTFDIVCDGEVTFSSNELHEVYNNVKFMRDKLSSDVSFVSHAWIRNDISNGKTQESAVFELVSHTFEEVLDANQNLTGYADRLNQKMVKDKNGTERPLSPLEKFTACYFYVANSIEYSTEGDDTNQPTETRDIIKVLQNMRGCCVGKSESLKTLLGLVGINACGITVKAPLEGMSPDRLKTYQQSMELIDTTEREIANMEKQLKTMPKHTEAYRNRATRLLLLRHKLDELKNALDLEDHYRVVVELDDDVYDFHAVLASEPSIDIKGLNIVPLNDALLPLTELGEQTYGYNVNAENINEFVEKMGRLGSVIEYSEDGVFSEDDKIHLVGRLRDYLRGTIKNITNSPLLDDINKNREKRRQQRHDEAAKAGINPITLAVDDLLEQDARYEVREAIEEFFSHLLTCEDNFEMRQYISEKREAPSNDDCDHLLFDLYDRARTYFAMAAKDIGYGDRQKAKDAIDSFKNFQTPSVETWKKVLSHKTLLLDDKEKGEDLNKILLEFLEAEAEYERAQS